MRFVWITAVKDLRRHRRDPLALIMAIGIPLLIGGLMTLISGGRDGPQPKAHILVADVDDSFVSGVLVGALSNDAIGDLIVAENVDSLAGRERMDKGDASALLVIPGGFGQAVLEEQPTTLQLFTNPSQTILPGIVEEALSILVDAGFYVHRLVGEDLFDIAQGPPTGQKSFPDMQISDFSVKINQTVDRLGTYLFPPVIQIETVAEPVEPQDESQPSAALYFLPGILFMSLLFLAQSLSMDLWVERDQKTLRRVVVSPQSARTFLLGKLLSGAGVVAGIALVALSIGFAYFGLRAPLLPLALLWTTLSGVFLIALMIVIQVYSPSQRAGGVFSMVLLFPLMMVGGSFFPFEVMPSGLAAVGRLTPNGWALTQLKNILLDTADLRSMLLTTGGLVATSALLFLISARRINKGFAQG